jgi:hypothetical protein
VQVWTEVTNIAAETVTFTRHYRFSDGQELRSESSLRFRDEQRLRESLTISGFKIEHIYGGWQRQPIGSGDGELIVIARALGSEEKRSLQSSPTTQA